MDHLPRSEAATPSPTVRPSLWAVAGGKGGVGRSLLVANMGIQMARLGKRVAVADLDLHGSNLHTYLGLKQVKRSLENLVNEEMSSLAPLLLDTSVPNLKLLAGIQRPLKSSDRAPLVERFLRLSASLPLDYLLLDCGSGRSEETLDLFRAGQRGILVSTPEPSSAESLYLFTEALLQRVLASSLAPAEVQGFLRAREMGGSGSEGWRSFRSAVEQLRAEGGDAARKIQEALKPLRLRLLLNQVRSDADGDLAIILKTGFEKFFGLELEFIGEVEFDLSVLQSIQKRKPLSQQYPNSPSTQGVERAVSRLLTPFRDNGSHPDSITQDLAALDYYSLLEVEPTASSKDIQRAYQLLKQAYDPGSCFLHPLLSADQIQRANDLVETAYRTLIFLETRTEYDRKRGAGRGSPGSGGSADPPQAAVSAKEEHVGLPGKEETRPPVPAGSPEKEGDPAKDRKGPVTPSDNPVPGRGLPVTGASLRRFREALRLPLEVIAEKTKIRPSTLEALEADRFSELPAPVFLKAFLRQLASCLGLDPSVVSREYMDRMRGGGTPPRRQG